MTLSGHKLSALVFLSENLFFINTIKKGKSMNNKFKKITALTLSAVMLCTNFAACKPSSSNKSNPVAVDEFGEVDMEVALQYETDVDALVAELESREVDPTKPVSQNSNEKTLKVFNYLREIYGSKTLVAQQMMNSKHYEDDVYYKANEDLPAIKGFDFIFSNAREPNNYQVDEAIAWHQESGGLVTFTWHWNVPRKIGNSAFGTAFYSDEIEDFSLANAVTPGTEEYEVIIKDIDTIAVQLQRLEAADVPVLWRPLHEASGKWFWWGGISREEPTPQECYKKLWYILFDRLENYHKLTNLIWVWNGQDKQHMVNPNTYDIAGMDFYGTEDDHSSQIGNYNLLTQISAEGKMLALSECGTLPAVEEMEKDGIAWLYCMLWYGDFVFEAGSTGSATIDLNGFASINTKRMSEEFFKNYLASDKIVTWKKLPDWDGTNRNLPEQIKTRIDLANWAANN